MSGSLDALTPATVRDLDAAGLAELAGEIRRFLVEKVCASGGHLGSNLGVVELTLALHRVFDSPVDRIVFDTGHQSYVHKILTGRAGDFDGLRRAGGLSGYPSRAESGHDLVENSHASTSLSYAYGLVRGYAVAGQDDRRVVAVLGDGALTGGMALEALNAIAGDRERGPVIVLNDNGLSYSPTVGGLAEHLAALRHGSAPDGGVFGRLGLRYLGPVDGHDLAETERALREAAAEPGPVVVHCVTVKGKGFRYAEQDPVDRFHAIGRLDPRTGEPRTPGVRTFTDVFATEMVRLGAADPDVVAVTAAMPGPTGLGPFAERFGRRVVDAGIAEQHALTTAAGLAMAGRRPVVAVYATFLNRALDQVIMDIALHELPVVIALDRAGVTGDDGASHNGVWDLSLLSVVPGLRIAAPRDGARLRAALRAAFRSGGPTVVRYPKGALPAPVPTMFRVGGVDVLATDPADDVLIVSAGPLAAMCLEAAALLAERGLGVTVVDPRWLKPVPATLLAMTRQFRLVVTVEDNLRVGGFGSQLERAMRDADVRTPVAVHGVPQGFLDHGRRADLLADAGLTADAVVADTFRRVGHLCPAVDVPATAR